MRPILFSFSRFEFAAAPVFAGLAALAAYAVFESRRRRLGFSDDDFWGLVLALALGSVLGSAAVYALLYGGGAAANWEHARATGRPAGGSFFGTLWGAAAAAWLSCRARGLSFSRAADALGLAAPLGLAVMRAGCLLGGCCYGRPTALPWAAAFVSERCAVPQALRGVPLHPVQVYEGLLGLAAFLAFRRWLLPAVDGGRLRAGSVLPAWLVLYALYRLLGEGLRGGDQGVLLLAGLGTSRLLALATLAGAVLLWRRAR